MPFISVTLIGCCCCLLLATEVCEDKSHDTTHSEVREGGLQRSNTLPWLPVTLPQSVIAVLKSKQWLKREISMLLKLAVPIVSLVASYYKTNKLTE